MISSSLFPQNLSTANSSAVDPVTTTLSLLAIVSTDEFTCVCTSSNLLGNSDVDCVCSENSEVSIFLYLCSYSSSHSWHCSRAHCLRNAACINKSQLTVTPSIVSSDYELLLPWNRTRLACPTPALAVVTAGVLSVLISLLSTPLNSHPSLSR